MFGICRKAWKRALGNARDFGICKALHDTAYQSLSHLAGYMVLKTMKLTRVEPGFLTIDEQYRCGFLDRNALLEFTKNPQYEMTEEFLDEVFASGNECFAILHDGTLASYGWYGKVPTPISSELTLHFSRNYVYMWKGYTHPNYRGRRLHAIGMARALQSYLERGYKGLLSFVEANNYRSLNSVYRLGYEDTGNIYAVRLLGRYRMYHAWGCRAYGLRLRPAEKALELTTRAVRNDPREAPSEWRPQTARTRPS